MNPNINEIESGSTEKTSRTTTLCSRSSTRVRKEKDFTESKASKVSSNPSVLTFSYFL